MKRCNSKIGEKVYFKSDKYKPEDMYFTYPYVTYEKEEQTLDQLEINEKKELISKIKDNIGFTVLDLFDMIEDGNGISVAVLSENRENIEISVDAKFFRSAKKHKKLMKRKQEENENA